MARRAGLRWGGTDPLAHKDTALSLKSKTGKAPLKVNSSTQVNNLHADLADGKHSADLQNKSYVFNLTAPSQSQNYVFFSLAGLPAGKYLFNSDVTVGITGSPSFVACFILPVTGLNNVPTNVALGPPTVLPTSSAATATSTPQPRCVSAARRAVAPT